MIIDYSTLRPPMTVLKAAGVTAVGRYIGWDGEPGYSNIRKNLTTTEARELLAAGMEIFLAFEYAADAALKGAVQGTADAHLATRQLHDLGAPAGVTVYFALDFDIGDFAPGSSDPRAKLGPAAHYFDAINATKPAYKVGVYGGYPAVSRVLDAKLAGMAWQTIAWSGGRWDGRAVLRQLVTQVLGAADVDLHEGRSPDFGQWPRPRVTPTAFRQVADGTLSLRQFEAERYQIANPDDPAVIRGVILAANLTMEHGTLADRKALIDYVISPGSAQAMPAGLVFYTLNK